MRALFVTLAFICAAIIAGDAAAKPLPVRGVKQQFDLYLELESGSPAPDIKVLPGGQALVFDVATPPKALRAQLEVLPDGLQHRTRATESGTRVWLHHADRPLRFEQRVERNGRKRTFHLAVGAWSEAQRLRDLGQRVRLGTPAPRNLGANLELWNEAQAATAKGELQLAKRLWEKVFAVGALRNLAALRIADLYIVSGHVNEAISRLRNVSRNFPRSPGAALARLSMLELQAIIGEGSPTTEQAEIAAASVSGLRYPPFARYRASEVMAQLGARDEALAHFPEIRRLPPVWQKRAKATAEKLYALLVLTPSLQGLAMEAATQYEAWYSQFEDHPALDVIEAEVGEAYLRLGMFEAAARILRDRLRRFPTPVEEAQIVTDLATAYDATKDLERHREVVAFQLLRHRDHPAITDMIRSLAFREYEDHGLATALVRLDEALAALRNRDFVRSVLATKLDLVEAYGTPAQTIADTERMRAVGFDDEPKRSRALALALAAEGRHAEAIELLRAWVDRTTDPERRDELAYALARSEAAIGNNEAADAIVERLSQRSTRWGLVARTWQHERLLDDLVVALETQQSALAQASAPAAASAPM